uniref:Uncharacterized protein n=1 Tax=Paenibacillus polymyxa TaxID=1406 RepID=A0AAE9PVL3_PAEPO
MDLVTEAKSNTIAMNVMVHLPQTGVATVKRGQRWCLAELF